MNFKHATLARDNPVVPSRWQATRNTAWPSTIVDSAPLASIMYHTSVPKGSTHGWSTMNENGTRESLSPLKGGQPARPLTRRALLIRGGTLTLGATFASPLLAACGSSTSSSRGVSTINWAQSAGPPDMNPLRRFDTQGSMVLALGLEGLLKYDRDFRLTPNLASDFGPSADLLTWTFKLKKGIPFSDGATLTIDDVVYSYQQHLTNPQSAFGFFYDVVKSISAKGSDLIVNLKRPDSIFGFTAAHTAGFIWQKSSGEKMGKKIGTPGNLPIGTGPYKFTEYVLNDHVSLTTNSKYHGSAPLVKRLTIRTIPDDSSRLLALRAGQVSGTYDVPPEQLKQWQNLKNGRVDKAKGLGVAYLSFNTQVAPFNDVHMRRAFSYAIDREGLIKSAIGGAGEVATAFVPPLFWSALGLSESDVLAEYAKFPQYAFDLDKAKSEIKSSRYPDGVTVKVDYPSSYQRLGKILLSVQQNLAPLGVKVQVGQINEDQWYAELYNTKNQFPLVVGFYRPDYPDPANYASFFSTAQIGGGNNYGGYRNPRVDALLDEQSRTTTPAKRIDPLMKVLDIVAGDAVVAPVWWESSLLATSRDITAYTDPVWYLDPWTTTIKPAH